jgi:hypothetical protein
LDDKIVAAWNGLTISALARAAQVLGDETYAIAATRTAEFIQRELYDEKRGALARSYRAGRGASEGFAEDYASLIQSLIDLYETTFAIRWLRWALRLQATMDELFWDAERGGYFNSAVGETNLVLRLKEDYDGAEPAPSSVGAMNLWRLAAVSDDEPGFRARALRTIGAFRTRWTETPQALPQMLCAAELMFGPERQVVLAGDPGASDFRELAAVLHQGFGPKHVLYAADGAEGQQWLAERSPWLAAIKPTNHRATAYVCEHYICRQPVADAAGLRALLR